MINHLIKKVNKFFNEIYLRKSLKDFFLINLNHNKNIFYEYILICSGTESF